MRRNPHEGTTVGAGRRNGGVDRCNSRWVSLLPGRFLCVYVLMLQFCIANAFVALGHFFALLVFCERPRSLGSLDINTNKPASAAVWHSHTYIENLYPTEIYKVKNLMFFGISVESFMGSGKQNRKKNKRRAHKQTQQQKPETTERRHFYFRPDWGRSERTTLVYVWMSWVLKGFQLDSARPYVCLCLACCRWFSNCKIWQIFDFQFVFHPILIFFPAATHFFSLVFLGGFHVFS